MITFIELNSFLKIRGLAPTGGQAKNLIRDKQVLVNGTIETRNKKKLVAGDIVSVDNKDYVVTKNECLKTQEKVK